MEPTGSPFTFNPFDEATRRDPFPLFARARREHPVWAHEGMPLFSVFRYADVQAILRDPVAWTSAFPAAPGFEPEDILPTMLVSDPPEHTRLRGLVNQAFTPRMIRGLAPRLHEIATGLLDDALAKGEVDLMEALACPLPVIAIAEMMGIPVDDRPRFKEWSDTLTAVLGAVLFGAPPDELMAAQRRVRKEMQAYFAALVEERRQRPGDDLLSALAAAELEGSRLSFDELLAMLILILVAGNETTTNLIGNAVLELLAHPDQLALLRARPELLPGAVSEVLRYSSPIQCDPRRAAREVEVHGVRIEAGAFVLCWLGSANRDEELFERPEVFDITRTDTHHLAFGFGPHYCLGSSLATLEGEIALGELLRRTRSFARIDEAALPLPATFIFRGVTRLPVRVEAA
jgi:cytochrome P450